VRSKVQLTLEIDAKLLSFVKLFRQNQKREHIPLEQDLNNILAYGIGKLLRIDELKPEDAKTEG